MNVKFEIEKQALALAADIGLQPFEVTAFSMALSLKRIADALEKLAVDGSNVEVSLHNLSEAFFDTVTEETRNVGHP